MHNLPLLVSAVETCRTLATPYLNLAYRATALRFYGDFATASPLYAASPAAGSRYIPRNGPRALYVSTDPVTPYYECNQDFLAVLHSQAFPNVLGQSGDLRPQLLVMMCIYLRVTRLLNLFDDSVLSRLHIINPIELLTPWKGVSDPTPTQQLGQTVYDDNYFEGILYPSAQIRGAQNIVLFMDRLAPTSLVHFRGFSPPPSHLRDAQHPTVQHNSM